MPVAHLLLNQVKFSCIEYVQDERTLKTTKTLAEIKILMFSKGNSFKETFLVHYPKNKTAQRFILIWQPMDFSKKKLKKTFLSSCIGHNGRLVNIISCLRWNRDQFYYCSTS
tara:strand:- start:178 stop:513 length:336 start_codon:yes stop_codon:yes gene_type:complete